MTNLDKLNITRHLCKRADSFVQDNPLLSSIGINAGVGLGTMGLSKGYGAIPGFFSQSSSAVKRNDQERIRKTLEKIVLKNKFNISRHLPGQMNMMSPQQAAVSFQPQGAWRGTAYLSNKGHPSIHAHELGHILGPKAFTGSIPKITNFGGVAASLMSVFNTTDKKRAERDAIIGSSLIGLTHLPREIDASARGFSVLSKLQKRNPKNLALALPSRLKTFLGLPTYALATLAPYASFKAREGMGVFDKKK